jgi:hypothetical protein
MKADLLPVNVANEAKRLLKSFPRVYIEFEKGEYRVSTGFTTKKKYSKDHKFIGSLIPEDVFNSTELMENYINEFYEYPANYLGERDYAKLEEAKPKYDRKTGVMTRGVWKMTNEGNLRLFGQETIKFE